jgi:hypothetical protein
VIQSQPRQIVWKTLSQKTLHKNRADGVAQGEGPEFKPQYHRKKKSGGSWLNGENLVKVMSQAHLELKTEYPRTADGAGVSETLNSTQSGPYTDSVTN